MSKFVLAISYGNYLIQNGGTDKVIREHCRMFNGVQCDYLFLFPVVRKINIGKRKKEVRYWGLDINEHFQGLYTFDQLIKEMSNYQRKNECLAIFIHHTWRIKSEEVLEICKLNNRMIYYYLHDFQSICSNRNFINEKEEFCGYSSNNFLCDKKCYYYKKSKNNRNDFTNLLEEYKDRIICVAPSENTKKIFQSTFPKYKSNFISIDHQKCLNTEKIDEWENSKIKIAYIGAQALIKGWCDFKEIINSLEKEKYDLYYFGVGTERLDQVKKVEVSVREQGNNAMQDTLRLNHIDVVLLLSCWPETYSYTYYESLAAGCYVLAYNDSGNIADQVLKRKNGKVFKNKNEVKEYLMKSETLKKDLSEYRKKLLLTPNKLVPNEEIVKRVVESNGKKADIDQNYKWNKARRSFFPEIIYKIQNRKKL